ncbi:uncharacterized protein LOC100890369 isoform X2 [Strongylocentrotus purpuratus]|uniref:Death domain-containing protein n=1 Tax=Strongylocentrotus purpuratus TaxID=7668 RepID=A0A7M7T2B2_STRPU|nr:uncharacterized protein LOC100890369 isoform X2 [Strongylocentrotus purpuratus]|eukprot:XP_003728746.1 PREDICTED: uncharacterized protein LOC100890369 isoform X2 [Strongylocentrotus purpuratus]
MAPKASPDTRDLGDQLSCSEIMSLIGNLHKGTPLTDLVIQFIKIADAAREMLYTWHSNEDPANAQRVLAEISKVEGGAPTLMQDIRPISLPEPFQPSSAPYLSRPRKRTQCSQTPAGHETNTPGASEPSSAPCPSRPKIRAVANPPQQPDTVPMRIPQQTSDEITEIKLRDVSIKLGGEWRTVGTYLGFGNSQIEVMQEEYRVVKECIFQMLLQWRKTNGVKATKEKFKKALRRSQREDLADFIDEADDLILAN